MFVKYCTHSAGGSGEVGYDKSAGTEVCTQQVNKRAYISMGTAVCTLQMVRSGVGYEESE